MFQFQKYGAGVQACYPCILLILTHFKGAAPKTVVLTQPLFNYLSTQNNYFLK